MSSPSPAIDSLPNEELLEQLSPRQQRDLDIEFYAYLRDMNFISEVQEPRELVERVQKIGAFALAAWKQCSERFVERLRAEGMIQMPRENPEEYEFEQRFEKERP